MLGTVEGGYQQPYEEDLAPGHRGVAVDVQFGMGGDLDAPVGLLAAVRTKFGSHQGQFGVGVGAYAFTPPAAVGAYGRAGINVLQAEVWSGEFAFGMGSPWVNAGVYLLPEAMGANSLTGDHGGLVFTVGASTGYDVRFADVPNTGWWAVTVGLGFLAFTTR